MNILVVCHYGMYQNLTNSFVHQQAAALAALGHCVRVVIPVPVGKRCRGRRFGPAVVRQQADGVTLCYCRCVSLSNWGADWFNMPSARLSLQRHLPQLLEEFRPDVIHAHTLGFDSELGKWLKKKLGVPLVVTTHGSDTSIPMERGEGAQMKAFCEGVDRIVAVSSVLGDKLRACGTTTPITAVLNGYAAQNRPSVSEKVPLSFLQVGHLQTQKRVDVTLRAVAKLREIHPEAVLTVIGAGPEREALETLSRELRMEDSVRFTGEISNREVLAEMSRTQFFVMPSVREGFGIVYLEAMASGCIAVGTEGEGIADLICHGENGFLVPPDDPDAIVKVIEHCLACPETAAAVAARGRQDAQALTWEKNAGRYADLFRELL